MKAAVITDETMLARPYYPAGTFELTKMQARTFQDLRDYYGSHRQAAFALGLTPRHYYRLRTGCNRLTGSTGKWIAIVGRLVRNGRRHKAVADLIPPHDDPRYPADSN